MRTTTADRLRQIMKERNLRQVDILELAKPHCEFAHTKLNKSDLSQFISGKVTPGQTKLFVLGRALNVNEAWLMGCDVPRERMESAFDTPMNPIRVAIHQLVDALPDEKLPYLEAFLSGLKNK